MELLYGHIEIAKWLVKKFDLGIEDVKSYNNFALRLSCEYGHLTVAKWLVKTFGLEVEYENLLNQ